MQRGKSSKCKPMLASPQLHTKMRCSLNLYSSTLMIIQNTTGTDPQHDPPKFRPRAELDKHAASSRSQRSFVPNTGYRIHKLRTYICMYVIMYVCMYVCIHTNTHVRIHVYIYIYVLCPYIRCGVSKFAFHGSIYACCKRMRAKQGCEAQLAREFPAVYREPAEHRSNTLSFDFFLSGI